MPFVCLTGDVHHDCRPKYDFRKSEFLEIQSRTRRWEYRTAEEYWTIANHHDFGVTLFVTGKSIEEHEAYWESLSKKKGIELGAHTYAAMPFDYLHALFGKTIKSYYGPYIYQRIDIKKTLAAFNRIHLRPLSWRTHGYWGNRTTNNLLSEFGFKVVSDNCRMGTLQMEPFGKNGNLKQVPINVLPDDRIFGFYCNKDYENMRREGKKVKDSILNGIAKKRDMVVQLHPICMRILDNCQTYEQILNRLSENNYLSLTMTALSEKCNDS